MNIARAEGETKTAAQAGQDALRDLDDLGIQRTDMAKNNICYTNRLAQFFVRYNTYSNKGCIGSI